MKRAVMLILLLVLLQGCATTHMTRLNTHPVPSTAPDKATLVIIRETYFGGGIVFWYYLDGKLIGETKGTDYFMTPVTPGPHYVVSATENATVAHIDFKPGRTYFLGQGVTIGIWRARSSGFYPMSRDKALEAMNNCDYLEYDPATGGEDMDPQLYEQAIEDYQNDVQENPESYRDILGYEGVVTN